MPNPIFLDVTSDDSLHYVSTCKCRHHQICGRNAQEDSDLCILHSPDAHKDTRHFSEALAAHRVSVGDRFVHFVFPSAIDFGGSFFAKGANFSHATFLDTVDFSDACFDGDVHFGSAVFSKSASFFGTMFHGSVCFDKTRFIDGAAYFGGASFSHNASFSRTSFGRGVLFDRARFAGNTVFIGGNSSQGVPTPVFSNCRVYFRNVIIDQSAKLSIIDADLRSCNLVDTDLSEARLSRITWPMDGKRPVIFDKLAPSERAAVRPAQLEASYESISRSYTRHGELDLARQFRFRANEIRSADPETAASTRVLLSMHNLLSGYGASFLRPLSLTILTALCCALLYYWSGIVAIEPDHAVTVPGGASRWETAVLHSLRSLFWADAQGTAAVTHFGHWLALFEHVIGPVLIASTFVAARRQLRS